MRPFDYARSESADAAVGQLSESVRPYAGGTDLLTRMKLDIDTPSGLIDLKTSDLPKGIEQTDDGLSIGALTTLTELEMSDLSGPYALLREAASLAATPQLRNRATLGGNLLQRPRCWYYRNTHVNCWLKGGEACPAKEGRNEHHALFGQQECVAVHPSDLASCLTALGASVVLQGENGTRTLTMDEFYALPEAGRRRETIIEDDELIVSVEVPAPAEGSSGTYLKAMDRKVWAFALVGVAAVIHRDGDTITEARLALSGVAPIPWRLEQAEAVLNGNVPSAELVDRAAEAAVADATPLEHNGYKIELAKRLVRRALTTLPLDKT